MLPPRHVYSMVLRNRSAKQVAVTVTYKDADGNADARNFDVPAYGTATAGQRTYTRGSATYVMEITKVSLNTVTRMRRAPPSLAAPFPGVTSPTSEYEVNIVENGSWLELAPKTSA